MRRPFNVKAPVAAVAAMLWAVGTGGAWAQTFAVINARLLDGSGAAPVSGGAILVEAVRS